MSKTREPGVAALFRVDPDGECRPALEGLTISNGICWSPAGDVMFHVDSTTQRIDRYAFDAATGGLGGAPRVRAIDPADGLPDGICADAEGGVWVSLFGGGAVLRYDERGVLSERVELPVTNPTCPAFGGDELATLYVTTAPPLGAEQERAEPAAGCVLALDSGVRGLPGSAFAG